MQEQFYMRQLQLFEDLSINNDQSRGYSGEDHLNEK